MKKLLLLLVCCISMSSISQVKTEPDNSASKISGRNESADYRAILVGKNIEKTPVIAEDKPQYPGGIAALNNYIRQNFKRKKGDPIGTINVSFMVEKDGRVREATIVSGLGERVDQEALRVIKSTRWIPYHSGNYLVRCQYTSISLN
jgi:TonB family protein